MDERICPVTDRPCIAELCKNGCGLQSSARCRFCRDCGPKGLPYVCLECRREFYRLASEVLLPVLGNLPVLDEGSLP